MDCFSIRDYQQTKEKQQLYHNKTEKKFLNCQTKGRIKTKFALTNIKDSSIKP